MNQTEHSKIINKIAKKYFKPANITQKGRSRSWIYESKWWRCLIEFQPSNWEKGTYLNIGICWLWYKKDYLSYDYATDHESRIESFVNYENEEAFELAISEMCKKACKIIEKYKALFKNINNLTKILKKYGVAGSDVRHLEFIVHDDLDSHIDAGYSGRLVLVFLHMAGVVAGYAFLRQRENVVHLDGFVAGDRGNDHPRPPVPPTGSPAWWRR